MTGIKLYPNFVYVSLVCLNGITMYVLMISETKVDDSSPDG